VVLAFAQAEALGARQRLLPQAEWLYVPDGLASLDAARALSARLWPLMDDQTALVALGGGTVMDLAKWLRHRPALGFEALCEALREGRPAPGRKALLVLLPSTAGTGSEVSRSATLWDLQAGSKLSLDPAWADAALVDPDWTHSVPLDVTLDSGLDALAHALEALWNRQAQPLSDALALAAALGAWLDRLGVSFACIEPEHADDAWQQALRGERVRNFIAAHAAGLRRDRH
jgi:hypothetical protein